MKKLLIILVSFVVILACQNVKKAPKPDRVIEEELMVKILTDIAVVKAAKGSHRRLMEEHHINPEAYILNKYDIDSVVFAQNNAWYANQLKEYERIFARVRDRLSASKEEYKLLSQKEDSIQAIKDSIAQAKTNKASDGPKFSIDELSKQSEEELSIEDEETARKKRFSKNTQLKNKKQ
ncbi:DUF4296 domain-containing protein [Aquimarina brevivitae]|uniref:Uncharacterized protein DUF4296 n=1 Tax=Aquimarina brevivitae TaxID=323412 RepID=A0A4Q7PKZ7_9FLAO|nr:DUF4296 domain-containing protein [Aquimarina brevivitae]RZS99642.1 uncharacterized protein DUF4296 [Aquimarina brevivitae]